MASRKAGVTGQDMLTTEKIMQTFRMPKELVAGLRAEADRKGLDLTALVVKLTNAFLDDFGLPEAAKAVLDEDRAALRMDRYTYLPHLIFQRSLAVRDQGPGFDAPRGARKGR
jgi:hypothetical protein